ncbi:hypothetical protein [Dendrosporobacter sp. 1207_IL3150]
MSVIAATNRHPHMSGFVDNSRYSCVNPPNYRCGLAKGYGLTVK